MWTAIALLLTGTQAHAQPSATDLTRLVTEGMTIKVSDDRGEVTKGRVEAVSSTAISLRVRGVTSRFLLQDIAKIEQDDGLKDGAFAGLVFGAIGGMINGATDAQGRGQRRRFVVGATSIGAAVWMGYGVLIDAAIRHHRVIYQRTRATVSVAPTIKLNEGGAAASIVLQF